MMNLGFDAYFAEEEINPIVLNGLDTKTKSHDFFSMKGNGYKKATVEPMKNSDFEEFYGKVDNAELSKKMLEEVKFTSDETVIEFGWSMENSNNE